MRNKNGWKDLPFVTVSVDEKDVNLFQNADSQLQFKITGAGSYQAACNGDATSLELFHNSSAKTFSKKLVVVVQASEKNQKN